MGTVPELGVRVQFSLGTNVNTPVFFSKYSHQNLGTVQVPWFKDFKVKT